MFKHSFDIGGGYISLKYYFEIHPFEDLNVLGILRYFKLPVF